MARQLGQTDDVTFWQVSHRGLSEERQHVVLAHRIELDVLHQHHFVRTLGIEDRIVDDLLQRRGVT